MFGAISGGLKEVSEITCDAFRCTLIHLLVKKGCDNLGTWEPEVTPVEKFKSLWYCIHDGVIEFQWKIEGLGRALQGQTYADYVAQQNEEFKRIFLADPSTWPDAYRGIFAMAQEVKAGPQPWEREWSASCDLSEEIRCLASKAGWHRLQDLIEIIRWALLSPQGQRAIEFNADKEEVDFSGPWDGPYALIRELLPVLVLTSHAMLKQQANGLNYSQGSMDALEASLDSLLENGGYRLRA